MQSTYRPLSKDETIPPTGRRPVVALHQDEPGVAQIRAYALAVALAHVNPVRVGEIRVEFRVENRSLEYSNFV